METDGVCVQVGMQEQSKQVKDVNIFKRTHENTLKHVPIETLKFAIDLS